jgi:hypothetical protein
MKTGSTGKLITKGTTYNIPFGCLETGRTFSFPESKKTKKLPNKISFLQTHGVAELGRVWFTLSTHQCLCFFFFSFLGSQTDTVQDLMTTPTKRSYQI